MKTKRRIFKCEICEHKQDISKTTENAYYRRGSQLKIKCEQCGGVCYDTGYKE